MDYKRKIAIIDLGSNSVRMNIMGFSDSGKYMLLDQAKEKVRLSEGMGEDLIIREVPLTRLFHTLELFKQLIQVFAVEEVFCFATAAVRSAANQAEVLERIKALTALDFTVISGETESYLDYLGVINTMDLQDALLIDLGGASTELILVKGRRLKRFVSLPLGSVNLSEQHLSLSKAEKAVKDALKEVKWLDEAKGLPMIGLGGTIRTVAKVARAEVHWPIFPIHNYSMDYPTVKKELRRIEHTPEEQLGSIEGISPNRSDILQRGLAPFKVLFEHLRPPAVRISTSGVREGYFFEHYHAVMGIPKVSLNVLEASVSQLEKHYQVNTQHADYVRTLALRLFDIFAGEFLPDDKLVLSVASRLHDIGMHVDYYSHHLHGFYLLVHSNLYGLNDERLIRAAILVGMHRQKPILFELAPYIKVIGREDYERTKALSLFLSLAEQLDRSESQKVHDITLEGRTLVIQLKPGFEASLEEKAAQLSIRKLQAKYGLDVVFRCIEAL